MSYQPQVDIHCHLLPDWDDGPRNLDEALAIARSAAEAGLQAIVATPHVDREMISRPDRPAHEIPAAAQRLQHEIEAAGIGLRVLPGAEVTLSPGLPSRLADEPWLCVGGLGRHVLLELPPGAPWTGDVDEVLFQIALRGVTPILAHPERYQDMQRDASLAQRVAGRGVLLQVTAHALAHDQGPAGQAAKCIVKAGLASFVASDTHTPGPNALSELAQASRTVASLLSEEGARRILVENPRLLLEGRDILPVDRSTATQLGAETKPPFLRRLFSLGRRRGI